MSPGGGFYPRPKYWPEYMCSNTIRPDVWLILLVFGGAYGNST